MLGKGYVIRGTTVPQNLPPRSIPPLALLKDLPRFHPSPTRFSSRPRYYSHQTPLRSQLGDARNDKLILKGYC